MFNDEIETKKKIIIKLKENEELFDGIFIDKHPTDIEIENAEEQIGLKIPENIINPWYRKNANI